MKSSTQLLIAVNAAYIVIIAALAIFISISWWYAEFMLGLELILYLIIQLLRSRRDEDSKELRKDQIIEIFNDEAKKKGYHIDFKKGNVYPAPREKLWKGEVEIRNATTFMDLFAVVTNDGYNAEVTTNKQAWMKMVYDLSADPNDYDTETIMTTDSITGRPQQITRRLRREQKKGDDDEWKE